ncbi:MAG: hypothetical protein ACOZF0_03095 [Thermodesulfobacteriota bacterium]
MDQGLNLCHREGISKNNPAAGTEATAETDKILELTRMIWSQSYRVDPDRIAVRIINESYSGSNRT